MMCRACITADAELCQIFASESFWQFDPGWRAATMSSEWQQTTFAPGHDTSVTIQHESLPWVK